MLLDGLEQSCYGLFPSVIDVCILGYVLYFSGARGHIDVRVEAQFLQHLTRKRESVMKHRLAREPRRISFLSTKRELQGVRRQPLYLSPTLHHV